MPFGLTSPGIGPYEANVIRTSDGIEVKASVAFDDDNMPWVLNKAIATRLLDEIPDPSRTDDDARFWKT
jgi:hypothetical protein